MFEIATRVDVVGVTAEQVFDFMIDCDDDQYREWWPEAHFRFHTVQSFPGHVGNVVFFDEVVGERRLKSYAVIRAVQKNRQIIWQLRRFISLPVRVELRLIEKANQLTIIHSTRLGFSGAGKYFDFIFRKLVSKEFQTHLHDHAAHEFHLLAKQLASAEQVSAANA